MEKKIRQKGAVLALTALLLPMIVVGTGLAVDLGNIYVQYSRLQNAADAAALAGAHNYAKTSNKVEADTAAKEYIQGKYNNMKKDENIGVPAPRLRQSDNKFYYRVDVQKEVPLYFLGSIYKKINPEKKDTFKVSAYSVASIPKSSGGLLDHMFIFKDRFDAVNPVENPDAYNKGNLNNSSPSLGPITTTYDGSVIYTDKIIETDNKNYKRFSYSTQRPENFDRFFTAAAAKYKNDQNHTVQQLYDQFDSHKPTFKNGKLISGYWSQATYEAYDYDKFITFMKNLTNKNAYELNTQKNDSFQQQIKTSNNDIFSHDCIRIKSDVGNVNIVINSALKKSNDPIYIYCEPYSWTRTMNIYTDGNFDVDNVRPIIICCDGSTKVHFDLNRNGRKNTFRGVIYAPNTDDEGLLVNAENCKFKGTLVARGITLRGKNSSYEYVDYMGNGSGSSGSGISTNNISLTNGDEIVWN